MWLSLYKFHGLWHIFVIEVNAQNLKFVIKIKEFNVFFILFIYLFINYYYYYFVIYVEV